MWMCVCVCGYTFVFISHLHTFVCLQACKCACVAWVCVCVFECGHAHACACMCVWACLSVTVWVFSYASEVEGVMHVCLFNHCFLLLSHHYSLHFLGSLQWVQHIPLLKETRAYCVFNCSYPQKDCIPSVSKSKFFPNLIILLILIPASLSCFRMSLC